MRTNKINLYTITPSNMTLQSENKTYATRTMTLGQDTFQRSNISFKGFAPENQYTFEGFKKSKPNISELLSKNELSIEEENRLLAHYQGMRNLINRGQEDKQLYDTFFEVANKFIEKDSLGKTPIIAETIMDSVFDLVKTSTRFKSQGQKYVVDGNMLDLVSPELIKKFNSNAPQKYELTLPENRAAMQEIAAQIDSGIIERLGLGSDLLEEAMTSRDSQMRGNACKELVKNQFFDLIQEYMNNLNDRLSQVEKSNVFEIGCSFAEQRKNKPKIYQRAIDAIRAGYICDEGRNIFENALKVIK